MLLFSYLFNARQFDGLVIAVLLSSVLLASSQTDEANSNDIPWEPAQLITKKCDLTNSFRIEDLCEAYYSSDCQGGTTEAPAEPLYDCKILSKLVDPLFNFDTAIMPQLIMTIYKNKVKVTDGENTIASFIGALQVLCKRFTQFGFSDCTKEAAPDFLNNITWSSAYSGACGDYFEEEISSAEKFYVPECLITKIKKAKETCSALYNNGCLTGSSFNVTFLP